MSQPSQHRPILLVAGAPPEDWFERLSAVEEQVDIRRGATEEETASLLPESDIAFAWEKGAFWVRDSLDKGTKLKWMQISSAGLERIMSPGLIESPVVLVNGQGLYAPALAEFVIFSVLFFVKSFRRIDANRRKHHWERFLGQEARGQTLAIIGYGGTGRETARQAKALGMKVIAVKRNISTVEGAEWVDELVPLERWYEALGAADFVCNALPSTDVTKGMFGEAEFRVMKESAIYINVGRGKTTQEDAMIRALKEGWIAGAGLDVFETEPLPEDSELWDMENIILSPHCTDVTTTYHIESARLLCDNVQRWLKDEPLLNVVEDKARGY
jgi:phosphoglycerate dehydrogenase-like enzyme